jgi:hypothetical protein
MNATANYPHNLLKLANLRRQFCSTLDGGRFITNQEKEFQVGNDIFGQFDFARLFIDGVKRNDSLALCFV